MMIYLILIFILLVVIFLLIIFRKKIEKIVVYQGPGRRIAEERKEKILELLQQKDRITNDEVQELVGVSDATATNYLQELENEGKIEQVGKQGRFVYYKSSKING